ncbi:NAD(P)H-quinone oxidoreductase [Pedobacter sp. G11]|uniref:NAD(P)H-quinone oxidoreductase n=1 Tax=Pedobacter sp. G11 TaxID=2482728 RepID=UPI000F5D666B|nr:NAD(P)H-quinone oxidoreductase [Pedobacter sp. G11]AZI26621.1 NAD(P)H-quinone oxidoreductase [Pedobacter sp. G11]
MKAVQITRPGNPAVLKLVDYPDPSPSDQQVRIAVKAAGLNRADIAQRQGKYPPPAGVPEQIPGLEIAGVVIECGKNVSQWKLGDKVCALLAGGGYAEQVVVEEGQCLSIPEHLSFAEAASLPEAIFTVWSNVFQRGALTKGEHFLVHGGSSGIGITAIQLAKAFGAKVFVTVGSAEKAKACISLGADIAINYKTQDFQKLLDPEGVDVILDMIGGSYLPRNIAIMRPEGRLVYINAMEGNSPEISIGEVMKKRLTITGSTLRGREYTFKKQLAKEIEEQVWPLLDTGQLKPLIYKTFSFEDVIQAHELMESSEHIGKIVLVRE